ncbi:MAG: HD domain-containing protein [Candidatus Aenigmatarchaeota archaeon]
MKRLFELANRIKDKDLRERTLKLLKNPQTKNPEFSKYRASDFSKIPAWIGAHHDYEGGLLDHVLAVTELSIGMAKSLEKIYGKEIKKIVKKGINYDYLIAGALLHDISKVFLIKKAGKEKQKMGVKWEFSGSMLDHAVFSSNLLFEHGFPEEVVHIVASHGGDLGSAGANPKTIEAWIVVQADNLGAMFESTIVHPSMSLQQLQFLLAPPSESGVK